MRTLYCLLFVFAPCVIEGSSSPGQQETAEPVKVSNAVVGNVRKRHPLSSLLADSVSDSKPSKIRPIAYSYYDYNYNRNGIGHSYTDFYDDSDDLQRDVKTTKARNKNYLLDWSIFVKPDWYVAKPASVVKVISSDVSGSRTKLGKQGKKKRHFYTKTDKMPISYTYYDEDWKIEKINSEEDKHQSYEKVADNDVKFKPLRNWLDAYNEPRPKIKTMHFKQIQDRGVDYVLTTTPRSRSGRYENHLEKERKAKDCIFYKNGKEVQSQEITERPAYSKTKTPLVGLSYIDPDYNIFLSHLSPKRKVITTRNKNKKKKKKKTKTNSSGTATRNKKDKKKKTKTNSRGTATRNKKDKKKKTKTNSSGTATTNKNNKKKKTKTNNSGTIEPLIGIEYYFGTMD